MIPGKFSLDELGLVNPTKDKDFDMVINPLFMQYFPRAVPLGETTKQPVEFFVRLEEIVHKVHDRGLRLADDFGCCNVLTQDGHPRIVDWYMSGKLPRKNGDGYEWFLTCDSEKVARLCKYYQKS